MASACSRSARSFIWTSSGSALSAPARQRRKSWDVSRRPSRKLFPSIWGLREPNWTPKRLPAAVFSDSFVAVAPVQEDLAAGGRCIAHLVFEAARIQASLLLARYFVRGARTIGQCHFHRGVLFGPALVEAVNLEQREAVNPRIILSPNAIETLRHERETIVEREPILIDEDGLAFVSYLQSIYEDPTAPKPANLAKHARSRQDPDRFGWRRAQLQDGPSSRLSRPSSLR
jgi:hypothetical protein